MTTAGDVATQALKKSGILGQGQSVTSEDIADALLDLGDMLAQWNEKRWLVWNSIDVSVVSTGATSYTVGPGGDIAVTPRPSRLSAAYLKQLNSNAGLNVNYPLEIIPSYAEFSRLALPGLVSFSKYVFLDSAYPLARVHPYPIPNKSIYELHLILKDAYPQTVAQSTSFASLPPFCIPAMKFCLAQRLRQAYGKGLRPDTALDKLAGDALRTMRSAQVQVSELVMPTILTRPGLYNILSDQSY